MFKSMFLINAEIRSGLIKNTNLYLKEPSNSSLFTQD